jgi:thiol-disulfide isomerase/thioredoxin
VRPRLVAALVAAALATLAGVQLGRHYLESAANPTTVLASARLSDVEGRPLALDQWKGKTLVINFWATWCAPCREEMPELSQLQSQYEAKNVQFVGIAVDSAANVAQFSKIHQIGYPLLVGGTDAIALSQELGNSVSALPFTIVLDPRGKVRLQKLGRISSQELAATLDTIARRG